MDLTLNAKVDAFLRFYATPSTTTDLARHSALVEALPSDPDALGTIIRGLLLHNFMAVLRGLELAERMVHMQTVGAAAIIDRVLELDPSSLDQRRPADRRMVGFCYHFAVLHCALLRSKGVPARTRCGFAGYFQPEQWIDHWVVEHWDGHRWRLNDPQIGRSDLTGDDFHDGVVAWELRRDGTLDPASHGNGERWGWDELRGSLINDVAALNKVEVAGWYWCVGSRSIQSNNHTQHSTLNLTQSQRRRRQPTPSLHSKTPSNETLAYGLRLMP